MVTPAALTYLVDWGPGTPSEDSDSDDDGGSDPAPPLFSCKQANLYAYAPIKDVLYHLDARDGSIANCIQKSATAMSLSIDAALHWTTMNQKEVAKLLLIRIPGARSAAK